MFTKDMIWKQIITLVLLSNVTSYNNAKLEKGSSMYWYRNEKLGKCIRTMVKKMIIKMYTNVK